ncbi:flippase [Thermodesulfovibrio sp. Kuro-1]|uniref:flippase n=1 Tax=Thermodesulfovibrio sp. Kuro-1 TaxID=2580394 RepID=UPI0011413D55|nr:flippase [Thermodesulfovibrio sp. Kuro-1]
MNLISSKTLQLKSKIYSLLTHTGFRKYFANTSWLMAEKVFRMAVGLFVGVWIARYLGPEQFGLLSYAQAFVALFSAIAGLGLDGIVVRELVKTPERRDELLGTAFWLKVLGAFATLIVIGIAVQFTSNDSFTNLLIFIIASSTIFQAFNVIDFYFQATVQGKYIAYANSISLFISSVVKIALILYKAPLIAFAMLALFDNLILALGYVYFYIKQTRALSIQYLKISTAKNLLRDSWPLIFGSITALIYMKIDVLLVKEFLGNKEVGYYIVSQRISESFLFITTSITQVAFPAIVKARQTNLNSYIEKIYTVYKILVAIAFLVCMIITLFSKWIILFLFSPMYEPSINVLKLYVWTTIFVFLSNGSWLFYWNENLQFLASLRLMIGAILNVILNFILIQKYGLAGAAISSLISYSISSYFFNAFNKRLIINFRLQTLALFHLLTLTLCCKNFNIKKR